MLKSIKAREPVSYDPQGQPTHAYELMKLLYELTDPKTPKEAIS